MSLLASSDDPHRYLGRPWHDPLFRPPGLVEQVRVSVRLNHRRPAVTEVSARGEPVRRVTYGELWRAVTARAARIPLDRSGLAGTVAILVENTIDALVSILAVMHSGAAAVVIDAAEPPQRRDEMLAALGCPLLTNVDGELVVTAPPERPAVADDPTPTWPVALVVFTTGSTAASKAVAQSGYAIAVNARAVARHHRLGPGTTLACPLPISHVNGLEFGMFGTLCAGGHAVLVRTYDPLHFAAALAACGAHLATTVPSVLGALVESRGTALPELRYFVSAAAPLHTATAQAVFERFGKRVVQGYGLSECMNFATTMPVDLSDDDYRALMLESTTPPVGRALSGCEVSIAPGPGNGTRTGPGVIGEVRVRGHSLMNGYLGNPLATAEALRGGWLRTGDLGRWEPGPDGRPLLTITGRLKHIAKCGGIGVSLAEVERAVLRSTAVRDACCVARPHGALGEALTLFVEPAAVGGAPVESDVRACVGTVVDPRRCALRVVVVERLPRLRSGKPDRVTLAAGAGAGSATGN